MAHEITSQGRLTVTSTAAGLLSRNVARHGFSLRVHPSSTVDVHLRWTTDADETEVTTSNSSWILRAGEMWFGNGEMQAGSLRVIGSAAGGGANDIIFYQEW